MSLVFTCVTVQGPASITVTGIFRPSSVKKRVMPIFRPRIAAGMALTGSSSRSEVGEHVSARVSSNVTGVVQRLSINNASGKMPPECKQQLRLDLDENARRDDQPVQGFHSAGVG